MYNTKRFIDGYTMGEVKMKTTRDIWPTAIAKLTSLTQERKIQWESRLPSPSIKKSPEDFIQTVYETNYKGKTLRLYSRSYKEIVNPPSPIMPTGIFMTRKEGEYWHEEIVLEILDINNNPVFEFPGSTWLKDLLFAVQYQVSGVKEYLDEILGEKET